MEEAVAGALLTSAHPTDASARNEAYRQLHHWASTEPAFVPALLAVAGAKGRDDAVRFAALAYLKNLLQRFWASGQGPFPEGNKSLVRNSIIELFAEENIKIARQSALCISVIVERDYPQFWPDFFTKLCDLIKARHQSPVFALRGFLTLWYTLKSIVVSKQDQARNALTQVAPELATFVGSAWLPSATHVIGHFDAFVKNPSAGKQASMNDLFQAELCKLSLKIECSLVLHLLRAKKSDAVPSQVLPKALEMCKAFTAARASAPMSPLSEYVDGYLTHFSKFLLQVQEKAHKAFMPFAPPFLQFCLGLLLQTVPSASPGTLPERFVVHCMAFVRLLIEGVRSAAEGLASSQISTMFTKDLVENLVKALVLYYLLPTPEDIGEWESDPENFFNEEIRCAWIDRRKACAEILLNSLVLKYPDYACPLIYGLFKQFLELDKGKGGKLSDDDVRQKDAIYFAFAISSDSLFYRNHITASTFKELLREPFANDVKNADPRFKLVRRRVAQIIENWSREIHKVPSVMPLVYQFLLALMNDQDVVVRLASTISFKIVIDDINFNPELLKPYLEQAVQSIFKVAADLSESETNIQIVQIISVLILGMGEHIRPFTPSLLKCMAHLWDTSKHNQLQKVEIIRTLVSLVRSLGKNATDYFEFLLPVLQQNIDVSSEDSLAVLEDGLRLWLTILRYVPFTPAMLDLYPKIVPILHRTVQEEGRILESVLNIIEGYVLMGGQDFIKVHAKQVLGVVEVMINQNGQEQHILSCQIINILLQLYPNDFVPAMENIFERILFLSTNPETDSQELLGTFYDSSLFYFAALVRLLVVNQDFFLHFFRATGQKPPFSSQNANLLAQWTDRLIIKLGHMVMHPIESIPMEYLDQCVELRRLFVVGLGKLLSLSVSLPGAEGEALLQRIPGFINFCAGLTVEYLRYAVKTTYITVTNKNNQIDMQRNKLHETDPVYRAAMDKYFTSKVDELAEARPNELSRDKLLQMLSPTILQQLTALLRPSSS